jgi:hydroxypyruvate isomerase
MRAGCLSYASRETFMIARWGLSTGEHAAQLEKDVEAAIEAAQRIGSQHLGLVAAASPDIPMVRQRQAMIDNLRRVAPRLERAGCILCLEGAIKQRSRS